MKPMTIVTEEQINELLDCLDKDIKHIHKSISQLNEMRKLVIKRDDIALGKLLQNIQNETDAYKNNESKRQSIRKELANAFGFTIEQMTLSTLESSLPDAKRAQITERKTQLQSLIIAHVMQHLQFLANQIAQQQMPPEMQQQIEQMSQQAMQMDPQSQMAVQQQIQSMIESMSSPILAQLSAEFLQSVQPPQQVDPLVQIRQQELGLRDKEIEFKNAQFQAKEQQDAMEKMADIEIQQQKADQSAMIQSEKNEIAKERLRQQAELKLIDLQARMNK